MTDALTHDDNSERMPNGRKTPDWVILAIACVAQFMVVLDVSIVNVALPSIGRDLHYSPTGLQWVVNAYVLTFAGFLLLGGRAADLFGRRRVYLFGLALFTIASLVGGLAQNSTELTAARAVQGIGGAFLSPATLTIVVTTFSGVRMAKALGTWAAVAGAGGAAGSILGGVLTAELSWRWVLFVNIPIGAAVAVAALLYLPESTRRVRDENSPRLDIGGAITVTAGLGALIFAIVGTDTHAWGSTYTLSILAASAVLLAIFAFIELKVAHTPLVPFRIFRSRSVSGANIVMFLVGAAFFSMWYFLSLYLAERPRLRGPENGDGLSPHGDLHHHRRPGQLAAPAQAGRPAPVGGGDAADERGLRLVHADFRQQSLLGQRVRPRVHRLVVHRRAVHARWPRPPPRVCTTPRRAWPRAC